MEAASLPLAESLKDTIARTIPYFEEEIRPHMEKGNRVLIAAHGNSLRALVMYFEKLTEEQIMQVNLPTGVPLVYEFGENFTVKEKAFLGDPAKVAEKMQKVANQGRGLSPAANTTKKRTGETRIPKHPVGVVLGKIK